MNQEQQLLNDIKLEMNKNLDRETVEYYGVYYDFYPNIDEYLDRIPNEKDKIVLAQWSNNRTKTNELISKLKINEFEMEKYMKLKSNNADINETLNFKLLDSKYDFLNDILDMLATDIEIQEQLTSLSDEKLELFKIMYTKLKEVTDYTIPYIVNILRRLGYVTPLNHPTNTVNRYPELIKELEGKIKNNEIISTEDIETLLFIYTSPSGCNVSNLEDIRNFTNPDSKDQLEIKEMIDNERNKEVKNIDNIKTALLFKTYGISLTKAKKLLQRYDISGLEINESNKDLFEMYEAIARIVYENDSNVLIQVYDEFLKQLNPKLDFMRITVFENDLRKEFARNLNNSVFKTENTNYILEDSIKIYDAGIDFKMIVTAIGAYQGNFKDQENYSEYWNKPTIRSHGNCCSLIANNNLSMANPKNIILGFSTMNENMLLLSGDRDINSTPDSRALNTTQKNFQNFYSPNTLINRTRGDYNELVYERRDLSANPKFYKKNPDYIVFIEEYENIDEYIRRYQNQPEKLEIVLNQKKEQDRMWRETLKAAKNFNVPVVKINREKCAKKEVEKIRTIIDEFKNTKNPNLIFEMITQFENNRVGNNDKHIPIRERYFSRNNMNFILSQIENVIINEKDEILKQLLLDTYIKVINNEKKQVEICRFVRKNGQTSGINFNGVLNRIENIKNVDLENQVLGGK